MDLISLSILLNFQGGNSRNRWLVDNGGLSRSGKVRPQLWTLHLMLSWTVFFFNLYSNTSCSIEQTLLQYLQDASSEVMTSESLSVDGMWGSIYFPALVLFGQVKIQGKYQINPLVHVNQELLKRSDGFHCGKGKSLEWVTRSDLSERSTYYFGLDMPLDRIFYSQVAWIARLLFFHIIVKSTNLVDCRVSWKLATDSSNDSVGEQINWPQGWLSFSSVVSGLLSRGSFSSLDVRLDFPLLQVTFGLPFRWDSFRVTPVVVCFFFPPFPNWNSKVAWKSVKTVKCCQDIKRIEAF